MGGCCTCMNRFSNLIAFSIMCVTTYIGVFGPPCKLSYDLLQELGYTGETFMQIAQKYPSMISPAWNVFPLVMVGVFGFEAFFILWQLCAKGDHQHLRSGVSWWFCLACICQTLWSILFVQEMLFLATVAMFAVSTSLHIVLLRLIVIEITPGAAGPGCCGAMNIWIPFGMHAAASGWFFVFSLMMFITFRFDSMPIELAASIFLLALSWAFNIVISVVNRNMWYGLTGAWALYNIAITQTQSDTISDDVSDAINYACLAFTAVLVVASAIGGTCFREVAMWLLYCFTGKPGELPHYIAPTEESDINRGRQDKTYSAVAT